ncbi:small rab-related gtpase [Anaeramoeba ignava]|uniref:Small rab-related gtpase n=1 Tax=Anaeramoeba ignava TaxID=1746090 RepID=A0A9Q0R7Q9_ANAIG|nr:small rab-related gtpase [Anaeramoeba ignava]
MDSNENLTFKIIVIGDSNVGKSSLMERFTNNAFLENFITTIGVDFWDTAGQERFRTVTRSFYRGANGVVIVYDITNRKSFENLQKWIEDVKLYSNNDPQILVLGNKSDLTERKVISTEAAKNFSSQFGASFYETSAKDSTNVDKAFFSLASKIQKKLFPSLNEKITLTLEENPERSSCCF